MWKRYWNHGVRSFYNEDKKAGLFLGFAERKESDHEKNMDVSGSGGPDRSAHGMRNGGKRRGNGECAERSACGGGRKWKS